MSARMSAGVAPRPSCTAAELEREIGRSRRRIGRSLDALAARLAPSRLLHEAIATASRCFGAEGRARSEGEPRFRIDPLALGLIGIGIAWLVAENAGRWRRRERDGDSGATGDGRENEQFPRRGGAPTTPSATAADPPAGNPLLVGLVGLALGAAVAALVPASPREADSLADAREELWRQAEAAGHRTAARLRNLGRSSAAAPAGEPTD